MFWLASSYKMRQVALNYLPVSVLTNNAGAETSVS